MVKIVYYVAASADGFIATPDGGVEWLERFEAADTDYGYAAFYSAIDGVILGSRTYEQALTFGGWPYAGMPTVVLSSRDLGDPPTGVSVVDEPPGAVVRRFGEMGAARVWLVGGGEVAGSFARAGLIDEYIVSFMPVLLGDGIPLMGKRGAAASLRLAELQRFDDVVQCTYRADDESPSTR